MLKMVFYTFLVGGIGTFLGGLIGILIKNKGTKQISLILSLASGIMLGLVFFDLLPEAIPFCGMILTIVSFFIGVFLVLLINLFVDKNTNITKNLSPYNTDTCKMATYSTGNNLSTKLNCNNYSVIINGDSSNGCSNLNKSLERNNNKNIYSFLYNNTSHISLNDNTLQTKTSDRKKVFKAGLILFFAIALHNLPEGIAMGSSYASNASTGIIFMVLITLHDIPEGISVVLPLVAGGMKKWKALLLTFISGLPTVIGGIIGFWLGGINSILLGCCLACAGGAMACVVFCEILPQSITKDNKMPSLMVVVGMMLGLALIYVL